MTDSSKKTVLIVLPALNEGAHIASVIQSIPGSLRAGSRSFKTRVLVVDDGSVDNTAAEAKRAGAIVLRHVVNTGAGGATRTGLRYAEYHPGDIAYIATIDADGQHATHDIARMLEYAAARHSDIIVGNRLHAANKSNMPWQRRFINWGGSLFSRMLFGIKVQDTQSGLRLYTAAAAPKISYFTLDRYGFCTETLWHATRQKLRIDEVPIDVTYTKEGMARGQSVWAAMEILRDLIRVRIAG